MIKIWAILIETGRMTLDDIDEEYREAVIAQMIEDEKERG